MMTETAGMVRASTGRSGGVRDERQERVPEFGFAAAVLGGEQQERVTVQPRD